MSDLKILSLLLLLSLAPADLSAKHVWTLQNPRPTVNTLSDVAWVGDRFVALGSRGTLVTSPDGVTWSMGNSGTGIWLNSLVRNDTQMLAVGDSGIPEPTWPWKK